MTKLVDEIRSGRHQPPAKQTVRAWGFDPDLRTVGWGVIVAEVYQTTATPLYYRAGIIRAEDSMLVQLSQVAEMVRAIVKWEKPLDMRLTEACTEHVIVEGQQVYRRGKTSGKADANDLLRLAQVTGSLQTHLFRVLRTEPEVVLPAAWKGQKEKPGMHKRCMEWLADHGSGQSGMVDLEDRYGKSAQHALDALCMAKWRLAE